MKNKNIYIILGGIIILGTIYYYYNKNKKIVASTDANSNNADVKSNVTPNNTTNVRPKDCPSKEELASSRYTKEGMDMLKAKGCL